VSKVAGRPKIGSKSAPILSELGISKKQSSRWQKVAKSKAGRWAQIRAEARERIMAGPTPGNAARGYARDWLAKQAGCSPRTAQDAITVYESGYMHTDGPGKRMVPKRYHSWGGSGRPRKNTKPASFLESIGVTPKQSSRWQKVGRLDPEPFEAFIKVKRGKLSGDKRVPQRLADLGISKRSRAGRATGNPRKA